jgi:DNA-binding Lrp family transcriptional regulator
MREIERKLLLELLKDSSRPMVEIAKNIGVSRQTVAKKIVQLKSEGVINSFTVRLNPERLGLQIKAYVFLHEDPDPRLRRENETEIKRFHQVTEFYRLFGRYSAVVEVLVRDGRELAALVKRIHKLRGVRETETFIVHSVIKNEPEAPIVHRLRGGG